jgi:hypothetical protein
MVSHDNCIRQKPPRPPAPAGVEQTLPGARESARLCAALAVPNPLPLDAPADLWRELVSQLLSKELPPGGAAWP